MKTIRWGIIGVGAVTEVKSGPAFYKADQSELVAVMRRDGDKARDFAQRHNVPRWYDDADALINDPEVDVVSIATPPHVHMEYTLKVAAAGKPVYCEKPMARTYDECLQMIEACNEAGVPLWVAYYRRMLPRFRKIKALVDEGAIGKLQAVTVRHSKPFTVRGDSLPWRVVPEIAGGGVFVDMAAHMIDFLDYLLGPIREVCGYAVNNGSPYPAEDAVGATFHYESGVIGTGLWCYSTAIRTDEIVLIGAEGTLSFACFDDSPLMMTKPDGTQTFAISNPPHIQQPLIESIIAELNGEGKCPSTGESAARTNWFMDEVLAGYRARSSAG